MAEILDIPVSLQQGIIKDLFRGRQKMLVACKLIRKSNGQIFSQTEGSRVFENDVHSMEELKLWVRQ